MRDLKAFLFDCARSAISGGRRYHIWMGTLTLIMLFGSYGNSVQLKDGLTLPARARRIDPPQLWPRHPPVRERKTVPDSWLELSIREGRNRQVRRMTAAVGLPTLRLIRYSVGPWTLDGLAPGETAELTTQGAWRAL